MGQLRRIGWLVRLVRLLVRFPADEVDERTGRLRVAHTLVAAVWSRTTMPSSSRMASAIS